MQSVVVQQSSRWVIERGGKSRGIRSVSAYENEKVPKTLHSPARITSTNSTEHLRSHVYVSQLYLKRNFGNTSSSNSIFQRLNLANATSQSSSEDRTLRISLPSSDSYPRSAPSSLPRSSLFPLSLSLPLALPFT